MSPAGCYPHASRPWFERFEEKYIPEPMSGCWLWIGTTHHGYGTFWIGRTKQAHRLSYEHFVGQIPDGLVLDHLCRNRACVNPAHLEAVTERVNILRGVGATARHAVKTHCPRGHVLPPPNAQNMRRCKTCAHARLKRTYWQEKEARCKTATTTAR